MAVYLAVVIAMVALDSYAFVLKSTVVPFLLLVAVLTGRFGGFINDWAIFLGSVVLFDALRSFEFAVTTRFELPMYAAYAIDWERWLCGGAIAPVSAQQWRASLGDPLWLDRLFILLHGSHFLFFFLFGFVLWYVRRAAFRSYAAGMLAVLYVSLLIHFLVPTIPPWLAARDFMLIPEVERLIQSTYNVHLPALVEMFDINPIAAMPSLHTAMPALCAFLALHYFGWIGAPVLLYAAGVWLAVIYLGEHYLVDVVAGLLLSLAVYLGIRRWGTPVEGLADAEVRNPHERLAWRPIATAMVLTASSFGFGHLSSLWLGPLPITQAFVERDLLGRSPGAHYFLGRLAFDAGDFVRAHAELSRAMNELTHPAQREVIRPFLERSATRLRDGRIPRGLAGK